MRGPQGPPAKRGCHPSLPQHLHPCWSKKTRLAVLPVETISPHGEEQYLLSTPPPPWAPGWQAGRPSCHPELILPPLVLSVILSYCTLFIHHLKTTLRWNSNAKHLTQKLTKQHFETMPQRFWRASHRQKPCCFWKAKGCLLAQKALKFPPGKTNQKALLYCYLSSQNRHSWTLQYFQMFDLRMQHFVTDKRSLTALELTS